VTEISRFRENITVEEIAECELEWFRGEIVLVDDITTFYEVFPRLLGHDLLGFDTETKPIFKKGRKNSVSLVQLSTDNLACLFRINKMGFPEELAKLLADPKVIKTGVAVHDDIKALQYIRRFTPHSFVDLQNTVKEFGIQCSGLKKLAAIILGIRISKKQQVTDWEAEELSEPQQIYAATDAWVCREIYEKLTRIN